MIFSAAASRPQKGFSLVELMTVVAIIGIMITIAGPQFSYFVSKARQSEAKAALVGIHAVETIFFAENASYTVCLSAAGYVPAATGRRYSVGFHNVDFSYVSCGPSGGQPCNQIDWSSSAVPCAPAAGDGVNQFLATTGLIPDDAVLLALPTDLTGNSFIACAAGAISGNPPTSWLGYDAWCINNLKTLSNDVTEL